MHLKDIAIMHFSNIWIITRIRNWSGISSPEYFSLSLDYTQKWFLYLILTLRWKTEFNWPENIWSTFILSSKLISFLHKNPKQFHYHLVNKMFFLFFQAVYDLLFEMLAILVYSLPNLVTSYSVSQDIINRSEQWWRVSFKILYFLLAKTSLIRLSVFCLNFLHSWQTSLHWGWKIMKNFAGIHDTNRDIL